MPTELEELVEFLHHGNTQITAENLVGYSTAQPSLFKRNQLEPVKDLKLLIKDYNPIAKNALIMLINISEDAEVLKNLAEDDAFLESLLRRVTDAKEPNANEMCMLLANLSKSPSITKLLTLKRDIPKPLSTSSLAIDQLLDCFVKGANNTYNKHADYDYLCYLFADLAKHEEGRKHFLTPVGEGSGASEGEAEAEEVLPLTKLTVFTEHDSAIRRRGVASTIKNVSFDIPAHDTLLSTTDVNLLPYILLPLMGNEEYTDEDSDGMLDECQLLPPDKVREKEADIILIHLETLLLLTTTKEGRARLRDVKVYPIVRELHVRVEDENVREACDRLVQVLMRGEEGDPDPDAEALEAAKAAHVDSKVEEVDEDEEIVDVL